MIPQLAEALNAVDQKEGRVVTIHESVLLRDVKRACERAGVTVVTNHGLRHSFASLCFYLKIPNRQIKEWGGWKNDATLNRIYIRLAASMQTENKNTFTKFFEDKKSANGTDPSAL
jgi:integrase